jgi:hypothetical protein
MLGGRILCRWGMWRARELSEFAIEALVELGE